MMETIKGLMAIGQMIARMPGYWASQVAAQAVEYESQMNQIMALTGWTRGEAQRQFDEFYETAWVASRLTAIQWFRNQVVEDIAAGRCEWEEGKARYRRR